MPRPRSRFRPRRVAIYVGALALVAYLAVFRISFLLGWTGVPTATITPPSSSPPQDTTPKIPFQKERRPREAQHSFRSDGIVDVHLDAPHPIYDLIHKAEKNWNTKHEKASRTLAEAVAEYKRRYSRSPPKGFEHWWDYVMIHNVQLPDEYDRIYHDIEPFWGISPAELQKAQARQEPQNGSFTIVSNEGQVALIFPEDDETNGDRAKHFAFTAKAKGQLELLKPVQEFLPDLRATFGPGALPNRFASYERRTAAVEAARTGNVVDVVQDDDPSGWASACSPSSPLRSASGSPPIPNLDALWHNSSKSLVHNHPLLMDPCQHPSLVYLNGLFQSQSPIASSLSPSFSLCSTALHHDILSVPTDNWVDQAHFGPSWHQKKYQKLHWRGSNAALFYESSNPIWNLTQRVRFVEATNANTGDLHVLPSAEHRHSAVGHPEKTEKSLLNDDWMDVKFKGKPTQCEEGIGGTCLELDRSFEFMARWEDQDQEKQWKYMIDLDGNGCSSRFKKLTMSKSLVFKPTVHAEWYTDRIEPWLHYVPLKYDYTDLYDVMTFFVGDIHKGSFAHDKMASAIGSQARRWSTTYWRKEDMTAYIFRLFLEYGRVMSSRRDEMGFGG